MIEYARKKDYYYDKCILLKNNQFQPGELVSMH